MFVTALALFSVASLGGGLAPTSLTLVIARLLRAGALRCARPVAARGINRSLR